MKLIKLPVTVAGEVSGQVSIRQAGNDARSLGRLKINFYKKDSAFVSSTTTEAEGYFNFLGLAPGSYIASVDTVQLSKLNLSVSKPSIAFTIVNNREGSVVDGLKFELLPIVEPAKEVVILIPEQELVAAQPPQEKVVKQVAARKSVEIPKSFTIKVTAFKQYETAKSTVPALQSSYRRTVIIVKDGIYYSICIDGFSTKKEADLILKHLTRRGFLYAFVKENFTDDKTKLIK
jgi:hypothetical protein